MHSLPIANQYMQTIGKLDATEGLMSEVFAYYYHYEKDATPLWMPQIIDLMMQDIEGVWLPNYLANQTSGIKTLPMRVLHPHRRATL